MLNRNLIYSYVYTQKDKDLEVFRDILIRVKEETFKSSSKLHFVFLPCWKRYGRNINQEKFESREKVLSIVKQLDIPIIDIHKVFYSHPDPLSLFPFRSRNHYNSNGYALVAKTINDYLLNE